ncbi:hypothetical protein D9611_011329 [Ephemerocybe angulata]|uniref:Uncharacterized protein n=1 Tax=Ephemerocybe angulata TaxID=980116 RepID=A0A8H5BCH5_9AGAR|nr:hypothetical protein D9611_011329 [Tulosesus angulatus]
MPMVRGLEAPGFTIRGRLANEHKEPPDDSVSECTSPKACPTMFQSFTLLSFSHGLGYRGVLPGPSHYEPQHGPDSPVLHRGIRLRSALPIRVPVLWRMYLKARDALWIPTDINLDKDKHEWVTSMSKCEQWIVTRALGFFATADGLLADNLTARFTQEVENTEAKYFYGLQVVVENIHAETFALIIDALLPDKEKKDLLSWSTMVPSIAFKNIWAVKWIFDYSSSFSERLVALVCVEGIFFASCFAMLAWIKSNGKMPGLSLARDLISRDENAHIDFACALFRRILPLPAASIVFDIVREAVDVETEFALGKSFTLSSRLLTVY